MCSNHMKHYSKNQNDKILLEFIFFLIHRKTFFIRKFLDDYPSVLRNGDKNKIKKYFINWVEHLNNCKLIKPKYEIINRSNDLNSTLFTIPTYKLTSDNISEGFIIYEKFNPNFLL